MTVFISWSGGRSRSVAAALKSFLANLDAGWKPWVSHKDIAVGADWRAELADNLRDATAAVVCMSPATLRSPWVQFECGALSVSCHCVCPYLVGVHGSVPGPLANLQASEATEEGTLAMVRALNKAHGEPLSQTKLASRFARFWPSLEASIRTAPEDAPAPVAANEYNILDKAAFLNLLSIHFSASLDRLTRAIEEGLEEFDAEPDKVNFDLLVMNTQRAVNEGRGLLAPFRCEAFGPVATFLDACLPPDKLRDRLREGLGLLAKTQPGRRKIAAYRLIQTEQEELMKTVRMRLEQVH